MSTVKGWKRVTFKWTATRGITTIVAFLITAFILEYLTVWIFLSIGLVDSSAFTYVVSVPFTGWMFNLVMSPLIHLIPVGVIIALVSSWIYLSKQFAFAPRKIESKKPQSRRKRHKPKHTSMKIWGKLRKVQLYFTRSNIRSASTIFSAFILLFALILLVENPWLVHDSIIGLYRGNPSFQGFVLGSMNAFRSIVQAWFPIWWVGSAINNGLLSAAPGFRSAIEGLGAFVATPFVTLDLVGKYVLCQNIAAWSSVMIAFAYGHRAYSKRLFKSR